MKSSSLTLSARFVFPVEGEPIADGCVSIQDGRIAWVGQAKERVADLDLGNVAIVPGFVNAHTHLELSALEGSSRGAEVAEDLVEDEVTGQLGHLAEVLLLRDLYRTRHTLCTSE